MKITKLLVANRSEIAIRVFRAASELNIRTVAVYADQDRLALHRFKADEAWPIGTGKGAIDAYLAADDIITTALSCGANAIHPGYGLLSENPDFAEKCRRAGLVFIGPQTESMRLLGDKVSARAIAERAGVPVMPASAPFSDSLDGANEAAQRIGFPLMIKAAFGGGGRGMRILGNEAEVEAEMRSAQREAKSAFGRGDIYLEKLVTQARHIEVQLLGDDHGNLIHLFERDCSIQRRHQKIVERAPAPWLSDSARRTVCEYALKIGRMVNYSNAGTVEFLMDAQSGAFYFIEVNPRIQVEHTVTEEVTGIDIVKAQIGLAAGARIGDAGSSIPAQDAVRLNGHALQCRITTEDPEHNFIPDYGRISAYRGATGFGIRLDGGTAYSGAIITRHYDPLLEKVTAWAPTAGEAARRMDRALREFRIRGVATNLTFLENIVGHPDFLDCRYTTRFIDETPALFCRVARRDRATKLLTYIADVTVNGHPETRNRPRPPDAVARPAPLFDAHGASGTADRLAREGPESFSRWLRDQRQLLFTDTTMRDAHQSLLATRMRSFDITRIAPAYAAGLPQLFSLECWGGATFDVAMRFLSEDPWDRLRDIRARIPNILLQMLLRGANAVGYTNYPDNVVRHFIARAAQSGIDVFRVFDCLNWVENMRIAIDAVLETGKLCEGTICYTGDIDDSRRCKYNLDYYLKLARELEAAGCHILCIKDMAGLLRPGAARRLFSALRETVDLPLHFHTHDTSGIAAASILAACDAGIDIVDAAMDSLSGTTSQPCLGSLVAALASHERRPDLSLEAIDRISHYWEAVRGQYLAFESDLRSGASEVYMHEMPGGQFTNLKAQARALGLEKKWAQVARAYRMVNILFGDIVKVTPSSKVVGDMALMMVSQGIGPDDVCDPDREIAFPESVVEMMRGELGQVPGGFPRALQKKVLKGAKPITVRPGALLRQEDLKARRAELEGHLQRAPNEEELAAFLMYPQIFLDFIKFRSHYGPVAALPTPVFFYGLEAGQEILVDLEPGKTLVIRCQSIGEADARGQVRVFFELNGQPRQVTVPDRAHGATQIAQREKAELENTRHVGAPLPGVITSVAVRAGQQVVAGDLLMTIEAMKMETTIHSEQAGTIEQILVEQGEQIDARDLLLVYAAK